jgi:hypothetical protein
MGADEGLLGSDEEEFQQVLQPVEIGSAPSAALPVLAMVPKLVSRQLSTAESAVTMKLSLLGIWLSPAVTVIVAVTVWFVWFAHGLLAGRLYPQVTSPEVGFDKYLGFSAGGRDFLFRRETKILGHRA